MNENPGQDRDKTGTPGKEHGGISEGGIDMFHFVCFCRSNDHNYLMLSDPGFFLAMDLATFIHHARSVRQANPLSPYSSAG